MKYIEKQWNSIHLAMLYPIGEHAAAMATKVMVADMQTQT